MLWYGGIFAVSSFIAFFLFYTLITSVIQAKTDDDLTNQARQFSTVLQERGIEAVENFALFEAQAAGEKKVFLPGKCPLTDWGFVPSLQLWC
jgi:hypothetical protein